MNNVCVTNQDACHWDTCSPQDVSYAVRSNLAQTSHFEIFIQQSLFSFTLCLHLGAAQYPPPPHPTSLRSAEMQQFRSIQAFTKTLTCIDVIDIGNILSRKKNMQETAVRA